MQAIAAIVLRPHLGRVFGIAHRGVEIGDAIKGAALPDPFVDRDPVRFAGRVPGICHEGLVAERGQGSADDLDPGAVRPQRHLAQAIICSPVTSSSGLAQRLRRSLVPSMTMTWVTPGAASTSRSKRLTPLSPRMSCRMRLPPSPWFITPIGRPRLS